MWSSIKIVELPKSFKQAVELQSVAKSTLFGGGSYLIAERSPAIHNLIDINNLIDNSIAQTDNDIQIGAGVSLQQIIYELSDIPNLAEAAKFSCPSKNIRNQRTLGGEIAKKRVQSDLFTYLIALNPLLEIRNPQKKMIRLREWDGKGIINKITINKIDLESSGFERFAVIPSAPAFMIVVVVRRALELDFVISGKAKKVYGNTIKLADFGKIELKKIINQSLKYFENDQYGSRKYKKSLVETGIMRAVGKI